MSAISASLTDSRIMMRRNLKHILRNPVTIFNAALMPVVLMLLLVYVFGNAFNVGEHYVEYATPGLILLAITYGLAGTAVSGELRHDQGHHQPVQGHECLPRCRPDRSRRGHHGEQLR